MAIFSRQFVGAAGVLFLSTPGLSQDWPQWRGPNRDGAVHGVNAPAEWPEALKEEWKVEVGEGIASPVAAGGNVYVFTRQKEDEVQLCLDLRIGKEKWRSEPYPAPFKPHPAAAAFGKYPRSTPTVGGGKVYTFGVSGVLSCLDAGTGKLLWRKHPSKCYPAYGASFSPLVAEGLCVVPVGDGVTEGALTAFDATTGEEQWRYADGSGPAYGSAILVNLAGERQVVTFTSLNLLGVSLATGKRLWRVEAPFDGRERCITPVLYKDLIVFAEYNQPLRAVRLEKAESGITAKDVWKANGLPLYYSSPVLAGDSLYGMSTRRGGCFFCLDARTGETRWEGPARLGRADRREANASLINAGGALLFLTNAGRLLVVKPSASAYELIAEYLVSRTDTYAHPVFLGDRILIKDGTTLRSFRVRPDSTQCGSCGTSPSAGAGTPQGFPS